MKTVILISKPGTVEVGQRGKEWLYTYFVDTKDKKILCCHGQDNGAWPEVSRKAIEQYNPDLIYCCYPKIMKINTADLRIQGNHMFKTRTIIRQTENGIVIMIKKANSR